MAILRGVENGFSIIRTARQGRLTISDHYGRVTSETNCSNGQTASLIGKVSLEKINSFYTQFGDWFGLVIIVSATLIIVFSFFKKTNQ